MEGRGRRALPLGTQEQRSCVALVPGGEVPVGRGGDHQAQARAEVGKAQRKERRLHVLAGAAQTASRGKRERQGGPGEACMALPLPWSRLPARAPCPAASRLPDPWDGCGVWGALQARLQPCQVSPARCSQGEVTAAAIAAQCPQRRCNNHPQDHRRLPGGMRITLSMAVFWQQVSLGPDYPGTGVLTLPLQHLPRRTPASFYPQEHKGNLLPNHNPCSTTPALGSFKLVGWGLQSPWRLWGQLHCRGQLGTKAWNVCLLPGPPAPTLTPLPASGWESVEARTSATLDTITVHAGQRSPVAPAGRGGRA